VWFVCVCVCACVCERETDRSEGVCTTSEFMKSEWVYDTWEPVDLMSKCKWFIGVNNTLD
jgi:hypothetical protein